MFTGAGALPFRHHETSLFISSSVPDVAPKDEAIDVVKTRGVLRQGQHG